MEKVAILGKLRSTKNLFQNIGGDVKNVARGIDDMFSESDGGNGLAAIQNFVKARPELKSTMNTNFGTQLAHRSPLILRTLGRDVGKVSPYSNMGIKFKTLKDLLGALGSDIRGI